MLAPLRWSYPPPDMGPGQVLEVLLGMAAREWVSPITLTAAGRSLLFPFVSRVVQCNDGGKKQMLMMSECWVPLPLALPLCVSGSPWGYVWGLPSGDTPRRLDRGPILFGVARSSVKAMCVCERPG